MQLDANGWLVGARRSPSPHCDERAAPADISLLVIHGISLPPGQFGGPYIEQLFHGQLDPQAHPYFASIHGLRVSSHFLIRRDGEIVQFVSCLQRAWHAGVSQFAGRDRCNDFSIGIELEGADDTPYAAAQYPALVALTRAIQQRWPAIGNACIAGHEDIAPGRKTDPGPAFDWLRYRAMLASAG
ncbi:1,6-anhydro-N-acetylmuramyl-L-alanine amidase AmpD [Permianibacter fluminis]|uniref:1,6-anhydro-N-acetylmuramyl-L-alanine amidase AmpD n=1 Tax=Permianibacter fluminis TaxID=2738515 RepID=UPI001B7D81AF|nr:1,6-anhydro-N-acetylmuramyl-L-alanine amidase AmpD [Permianibacter fluminis]